MLNSGIDQRKRDSFITTRLCPLYAQGGEHHSVFRDHCVHLTGHFLMVLGRGFWEKQPELREQFETALGHHSEDGNRELLSMKGDIPPASEHRI